MELGLVKTLSQSKIKIVVNWYSTSLFDLRAWDIETHFRVCVALRGAKRPKILSIPDLVAKRPKNNLQCYSMGAKRL